MNIICNNIMRVFRPTRTALRIALRIIPTEKPKTPNQVVHRNSECTVGGIPPGGTGTTVSQTMAENIQWCQKQGADGFSFLIQNTIRGNALGSDKRGLGYGGLFKTLAVEFDMYRDFAADDPNDNHIAVMVAGVGQPISGSHSISRIAETTDIPRLNEGVHKVKIVYFKT
jgi:hypothetical protein